MKKLFTLLCISVSLALVKAQSDSTSAGRRNDLMINPIALVLGIGSLSYEYHINHESSVGISTAFTIDDYVGDTNGYWFILPHYRYYFGKKYAGGFFAEGFAGAVGRRVDYWNVVYGPNYSFSNTTSDNVTQFGAGVGFGGKWITRKSVILEASVGIGRAFGNEDTEPTFGKGMLGIGYRF